MTAQNKVTLTFAGDATSLDRAFKQVQSSATHADESVSKSSQHIGEELEKTGRQARGVTEAFRGIGDASLLMGGELGVGAQNLLIASQAAHGLTKGTGTLISTLGLLRFGIIASGVALAGLGLEMESKSAGSANIFEKSIKDVNYALATNVHFVTQGIPIIGGLSKAWLNNADSASQAAHETDAYTNSLAAAQAQMAMNGLGQGSFSDTDGLGTGMSILDPANGDNAAWMAGLERDAAVIKTGTAHVAHAVSSGGGSVAKAMDTAAQAMKDKLAKWQGIADDFSNIAKGIADSLGPKLVQGDQSSLRLFPGASMLDKLKKQLADTLHLKKDLAALAKGGLSNGLLEQLTAGGLDSIGAADELLAGGKSGIRAVNKTAGQITAAGGSIAGADAARQFADSLKKPIKVTLSVGKGGDDVLDKWLQKALKTNGAKFYGLKAA